MTYLGSKVKCFGGPLHGKYWRTDIIYGRRFEVVTRRPPPLHLGSLFCCDAPMSFEPPLEERSTYYLMEFKECGHTKEGSRVHRGAWVGLLEGCELNEREYYDLQSELGHKPWEWDNGPPSILTQFDRWWEWKLYQNVLTGCRAPFAKVMQVW